MILQRKNMKGKIQIKSYIFKEQRKKIMDNCKKYIKRNTKEKRKKEGKKEITPIEKRKKIRKQK